MDEIHIVSRRSVIKEIKDAILGARKISKIHKNAQQIGQILQVLNDTIRQAVPLIEYAADAVQKRLPKTNESTIHPSMRKHSIRPISNTTNFNNYSKKTSHFYLDVFTKNNWSSEIIIFAVIAVGVIIIVGTLLVTRLTMKKNKKNVRFQDHRQIQETDSLRRSVDSVTSDNQD